MDEQITKLKKELERLYVSITFLKEALETGEESLLKDAYELCKEILKAKEK